MTLRLGYKASAEQSAPRTLLDGHAPFAFAWRRFIDTYARDILPRLRRTYA